MPMRRGGQITLGVERLAVSGVTDPDVRGALTEQMNAMDVKVWPRHTDLIRPFEGRGLTAIRMGR